MIRIERNASVKELTTFGLAARAAALARWHDAADLRRLLADGSLPRPFKPLGGGSNLLLTKDFGGTMLLRDSAPRATIDGLELRADAHATLDDLCALACRAGLRGMENLSGIPGSLGGALVQNAGAYGAETGRLMLNARLMDLQSGEIIEIDRRWLSPAYRSTRLKHESDRFMVLDATLQLKPGSEPADLDYGNLRQALDGADPTPEAVRRAVLATRRAKLPSPEQAGSAGSFFRNPEVTPERVPPGAPAYALPSGLVKVPAAWLIDQCGLKGVRCGGAMVWPQQPLVIVNAEGRASAADVLDLEHLICQTVLCRFGISLTAEVEHL